MPAERLSMRKVREVLRLKHALAMSYREISEATGSARRGWRVSCAGPRWSASPGRCRRGSMMRELERRLFPVAGEAQAGAPGHRLAEDARGAEAARRDAGAAVAGVSGRASGRLRLQPVLRSLRGVAQAPARRRCARRTWPARSCSSIAPATRWRCSIRRPARCAIGAHLRRRARGVQLHLRRGALDREAAGLDRRARQRASMRSAACRRRWCPTI